MNGKGAIVMRLNNGHHDFYEHPLVSQARHEAYRLADEIGGQFVVYVPIVIVERAQPRPPAHEHAVELPDARFDDLPF